jgi:hypothetical protein
MDIEFGSLAMWMSSIGTTGALFAIIYLLREQQRAQRRTENLQMLSQARLLTFWIERKPDDSLSVIVQNSSTEPAYNVSVIFREAGDGRYVELRSSDRKSITGVESVGDVAASAAKNNVDQGSPPRFMLGTLPPASKRQISVEFRTSSEKVPVKAELLFTDAAGLAWRRHDTGWIEENGFQLTVSEVLAQLNSTLGPKPPPWALLRRLRRWRRGRQKVTVELLRKGRWWSF